MMWFMGRVPGALELMKPVFPPSLPKTFTHDPAKGDARGAQTGGRTGPMPESMLEQMP
jgi:hypothetical protein